MDKLIIFLLISTANCYNISTQNIDQFMSSNDQNQTTSNGTAGSSQTFEEDYEQNVFFKVLHRKRRTNKRVTDNLFGIWFPVYIPQAETAYNYKETRHEQTQHHPPQPHLHENKELYKDCEKLPPFTPIFFPSDPPKVATKSLSNQAALHHKIIGPIFSSDEMVKSVIKDGQTEEVLGSSTTPETPNVEPLFYNSDLVVNRINPQEGNKEADTEVESGERKRPHMGYRSVDESKMPKNDSNDKTKSSKKNKHSIKKSKYPPKNDGNESDTPNYMFQKDEKITDNQPMSENEIDSDDAALPNEDSPDTALPNEDSPDTALPNKDSPDTALPNEDSPDTALPNEDSPNTTLPSDDSPDTTLPNEDLPFTVQPNEDSPDTTLPKEETLDETLSNVKSQDTTLPNNNLEEDTTLPSYSLNVQTSTNKLSTEKLNVSLFADDYDIEYEDDADTTVKYDSSNELTSEDINLPINGPPNTAVASASINVVGDENTSKKIQTNIPPEISIVGASINIDGFEIGMERPNILKTSLNVSDWDDNHEYGSEMTTEYEFAYKDETSTEMDDAHMYGSGMEDVYQSHSNDQAHSNDEAAKMSNVHSYDQGHQSALPNDQGVLEDYDEEQKTDSNDEDQTTPSKSRLSHDSAFGVKPIMQDEDTDDDIKAIIQYLDQDSTSDEPELAWNDDITGPGQELNQEPSVSSREEKAIATKSVATEKLNIVHDIQISESINTTFFDDNVMYEMNEMNVMNDFYDEFGDTDLTESNITEIFLTSGSPTWNGIQIVNAALILLTSLSLLRQ